MHREGPPLGGPSCVSGPKPLSVTSSPVIWSADGVPRSRMFDDVYYSAGGGLAESRAVFLSGCGLPEAWRGRQRFVVGELGFGCGLNILALLELWRQTREPGARLHIFSVEAFPMPAEDARRALATWPELDDLATRLVDRWPRRARGFHRVDFDDLGAVLDLAVMDVGEALDAWTGEADAWFLDGFSPARNPAMWRDEVLAAVALHSAPGARVSTFTVAGAVRQGLAAAGFSVEKRPGFGRKLERLEARRPALMTSEAMQTHNAGPASRVAILGAGIAGAALARAFHALGAHPLVIEAQDTAAGAFGNVTGLVMARLDAGGGPVARLYAQALARAVDLFDADPDCVIARQVVQLEAGPKDPSRFDRIADDDLFEPGALTRLSPAEVKDRLGEPASVGGLLMRDARVVERAPILRRWLAGARTHRAFVDRIERAGGAWRLIDSAGGEIAVADIVCIAAGVGAGRLAPHLPLSSVRGQVSLAETSTPPSAAIWGGYAIPTRTGVLFGATHDRGDAAVDIRIEDHRRNLETLRQARPRLADGLDPALLSGGAGLRAVTPDFLPLAGPVPATGEAGQDQSGLYILSGLGSRGLCAAPLLAEHIAATALGFASPLPGDLSEIVDPQRFDRRRDRRLRRSMRAPAVSGAGSPAPSERETH
jgi:tRNA 5-methylaminomethyl-2-thiouridine biosynthesis bifunctional protein